MTITKDFNKFAIAAGVNFRRLALGFEVNNMFACVDLLFFWVSIEYWNPKNAKL